MLVGPQSPHYSQTPGNIESPFCILSINLELLEIEVTTVLRILEILEISVVYMVGPLEILEI